MLVLRFSPTSPFASKVRIASALLGLEDRGTMESADVASPDEILKQQNHLGKIPILVLGNGETLYDSRVIVEYLDHIAGGGILLPQTEERFKALREQALGDGLSDAAVAIVYEKRFRTPENYDTGWVARQTDKVARSLAHAEEYLSTPASNIHIGHVALACALGYLDIRFDGKWRMEHPKLVSWLADFEARVPSYAKTAPPA